MRHRQVRFLLAIIGIVSPFVGMTSPAIQGKPSTTQTADQAKKMIKHLFDKVHALCHNKKLSDAQRKTRIQSIVNQSCDISHIAQWLLWPTWKNMDAQQRQDFIDISLSYMVDLFFKFAPRYLNNLEITRVSPLGRQEKDPNSSPQTPPKGFEVYAKVTHADEQRPVQVRIQIVGGKIRNMLVENVNLLEARKRDYQERLRKVHMDVDQFLVQLKKPKTKSQSVNPS